MKAAAICLLSSLFVQANDYATQPWTPEGETPPAARPRHAPAKKWGCQAEGEGTSYGFSYDYNARSEAEAKALSECRARSNAGSCHIVSCDSSD